MKILFVSHHLKGNDGWSRYARDFALAFKAQGHEVRCVVSELSPETDIVQTTGLGPNPLDYIVNPIKALQAARVINRALAEFQPDILQFPVEPYGTAIPFLRKGKTKIVLNAHSTFAFMPILVAAGIRRRLSNMLTRMTYARTDSVFCISQYTKGHLLRHMRSIGAEHLVKDKIEVVGGGVDPAVIMKNVPDVKNDKKEIIMAGAIKPRKGIKESIDALALVKSDFIYRIVGWYKPDDPYALLLKAKIAEYGLEKKVILMGRLSDEELMKLYATADLYLMLSTNNGADFEGYGLVYLEASARGVPCIGPSDSGVSDAISPGKSGYLVDQFNAPEVAKTIDHVLRDQPIKAADCIEWARLNSMTERAKTVRAIYERLI